MKSSVVKCTVDGNIGIITIDNPPMNPLCDAVLDGIKESITALREEESVKAVIITGSGEKAFVAGADIKELSVWTEETIEARLLKGQMIFSEIENFPAPIIAAINGYALGGGLELALCCDIRIASKNAVMGLPEVTLGIIPAYGGTQRLCQTIPIGYAKKMVFTGETVCAEEAHNIGLVQQVTEPEDLLKTAMSIAGKIASNGPLAVKGAKKAMNSIRSLSIKSGLTVELDVAKQVFNSEDKEEGVNAFINKREAQFKNK